MADRDLVVGQSSSVTELGGLAPIPTRMERRVGIDRARRIIKQRSHEVIHMLVLG